MFPEQNIQEWLDWRKGRIGASDVPIITEDSKFSTPYVLWQRKLGLIQDQPVNIAMQRGKDLEESVRQKVNSATGMQFAPKVVVREDIPWLHASLDGYDKQSGKILEVKVASNEDHEMVKSGIIPKGYYGQVQAALFTSDATECIYASYHLATDNTHIAYIPRDANYWEDIFPKIETFYGYMTNKTPPPLSDKDYVEISDEKFIDLCSLWKEANEMKKKFTDHEKFLRYKLLSYTDDGNCVGGGLRLTRVSKTPSIDWKAFWEDLVKIDPDVEKLINPESYRKGGEDIGYYRISEVK